jgi:pyridoxamine 5'-phosphate oxidase
MILSTASSDSKPSARIVLLKHVDAEGFVFYTNYNSRKGRELADNPVAALVFFWPALDCQVRVEGPVAKLAAGESDAYFRTRPRDGQLSSLTSNQSEIVGSRAELDNRFEELRREYEGKPIPRPVHWGGYRLRPDRIEFWQTRFARMNDRVLYELESDGRWSIRRLAP